MPKTEFSDAAPRGVLFDLDDTLIDIYRAPERAWQHVVAAVLPDLTEGRRAGLVKAIGQEVRRFLSDKEQRRSWRLEPRLVRAPVIARALEAQAVTTGHSTADTLARRYETYRRDTMQLHPGAVETLEHLRDRGIKLALITNGRADVQRHKIDHFGLAEYFHHIQIEGEAGYGKPDFRAFDDCLDALKIKADHAWMVGDDPYYDMEPAAALGIRPVWVSPSNANRNAGWARIGEVSELLNMIGL